MELMIKKLNVEIENKKILDDFELKIHPGEIHAIMGPNGVGKSTLSKVIMGDNHFTVTDGDILIDGESILSLSVDERSKKGIFLAMQNPTSIEGVSNQDFLRAALNAREETKMGLYDFILKVEKGMQELSMPKEMVHRDVNVGFSGGERKKNEVLQIKLLKPSFIILDEIDSGLDVDSLRIVCENINDYLKENPHTSVLIITHYPRILEYIRPSFVHIMHQGHITKTSDYSLALEIEKNGYNESSLGSNKVSEGKSCE